MVLGVGEGAAKGRPRAPESSSVMGPGLRYLWRSSMSHSAVTQRTGGPGRGGYYSAHRAVPQAGTQARVQGVMEDPIPTLNRCGRELGWGRRTH